MNETSCMKALCLAGRIILENGGETHRAEDTVARMAQALGLEGAEVFAIPSGLFLSYTNANGEPKTFVNRVHLRGVHLARVDRVNQLSRMLSGGQIAPDAVYPALVEAGRLGSDAPRWRPAFAAFVTAAGFALMFGGGVVDVLVGGLCAALTQLIPLLLRRDDASGSMMSVLLGGLVCSFIALSFQALTGLGAAEVMIASAIMPLVPGLSMTNAVQDIIRGDMVSGVAHCARAMMVAAMVAGGAVVGTHLCGMMGVVEQSAAAVGQLAPLYRVLLLSVSSLVAGAGFGALMCAPRRGVLWGAVLGALGYMAYWVSLQAGAPETAAMFAGMLLAAIGAQACARRFKMISTVFTTIAMMPMVPGLGLYRAMSAFAQGHMALGASTAAHTMALILMIALGMGLASALTGIHQMQKGRKR